MEATKRAEIIRFAKCLAIDPPTHFSSRGWQTETRGKMPSGTHVLAVYYNWNQSEKVLTHLRVYAKASERDDWQLVEGSWVSVVAD